MTTTHRDRLSERFDRDVLPHFDYLRRHAQFMTKRRADAEDLVQETMLRAYLGLASFEDGGNVRAWLHRIMVNIAVDNYRTAQRRPLLTLVGDYFPDGADPVNGSFRTEARSAEVCALEALPGGLSTAVRTLPGNLQLAIYYSFVLGYRNTEIADTLGIPVGTVASRLHHAKRRLRDALQDKTVG